MSNSAAAEKAASSFAEKMKQATSCVEAFAERLSSITSHPPTPQPTTATTPIAGLQRAEAVEAAQMKSQLSDLATQMQGMQNLLSSLVQPSPTPLPYAPPHAAHLHSMQYQDPRIALQQQQQTPPPFSPSTPTRAPITPLPHLSAEQMEELKNRFLHEALGRK